MSSALAQGSWCAPASALIVKMNTCFNDNGVWLAAVLPCRLHWAQHMHAVMLALVQPGPDSMGRTVGCGLLYVVRTAFGPRVVDRSVAARNTRREEAEEVSEKKAV